MEESDYSDSTIEKKSQFNSAISQLYRLDDLWKDSHKHSRDINYVKWNEDLDRVWLELSSDANKEDRETIEKINNKIGGAALYSINSLLRINNAILYAKIINIQKRLLIQKEEFLRQLLNKQGKGSAYEDLVEDYMD